jgi:hypothetical protein
MLGARSWVVSIAMLVLGCDGGAGEGTAPKPEVESAPTPTPTPTPEAELPTGTHVPMLPEIVVTNPGHACPELPALPADASEARKALHLYTVALRRLACEPELFRKTTDELRAELGLPAEAELDFSGLRDVQLKLPGQPTVADMAAVIGIDSPQIHVTWHAYLAIPRLGTNPTTAAFDRWGPGTMDLRVAYRVPRRRPGEPRLDVLPASPELAVRPSVIVGMPQAVVTMKPDPAAIPMLVTALERLTAEPELLAGELKEVAAGLGLQGERFSLWEPSSRSSDTIARSIGIAPGRTTLPAVELVNALGLRFARARCYNLEHDSWAVEVGTRTAIPWNGLELEIGLSSPRKRATVQPLEGLEVRSVRARSMAAGGLNFVAECTRSEPATAHSLKRSMGSAQLT